jgi:acylphosphatase
MVRAHVHFFGAVQGVGFRYTTQRFANTLQLKGWVKNLSDGGVEMVAEGTREQIDNLLYKLDKQFGNKIHRKEVDWLEAKKAFSGFEITY